MRNKHFRFFNFRGLNEKKGLRAPAAALATPADAEAPINAQFWWRNQNAEHWLVPTADSWNVARENKAKSLKMSG